MSDEPKEAKGANPGANTSARAKEVGKQDGNANQSSNEAASQSAGTNEPPDKTPPAPAGEGSNATNNPPVPPPRRAAARPAIPAPTSGPREQQPQGQQGGQEQEGSQKDVTMEVTIAGQMLINTITDYAQKMKPGRLITQAEGMRQQVSLCNAIFASINTLDADFKSVLTTILGILHRERDAAFRETHLFRYWDQVALSKNERRGFEKIITLLKTLADPKTRQTALRQVDFERLLQYGLTEKGRTRLAAYFGK